MDAKRSLGEFLKARRSQLRPEDLGLVTYGDQRRVPGLRREELAQLAGVSPSYYARLEQGQSLGASVEVLEAIAVALRLNDVERRHLHSLAAGTHRRAGRRTAARERITPALRELAAALVDVPMLVLGRRNDVLAWNRTGHALFAGHLPLDAPDQAATRPNMARLLFLDGHARELYADWPRKARAAVATLRMASSQHPDDPELEALIGELATHSPEFATLWSEHRVKAVAAAGYEMHHPVVGTLLVTQQTLRTEQDQSVVIVTAEPGSASQAGLVLLAQLANARPGADRDQHPVADRP